MIYIVSYFGKSNAGGVERVVQYLIDALQAANFNVTLVDKEALLTKRFFKCLYTYLPNKIWNALYPWLNAVYLRHIVRPEDIVISNGYNLVGCKIGLLIAHGSMREFVNIIKGVGKFSYPAWYEKLAAQQARQILAVSNRVKQEWIKHYQVMPTKIRVLNNCVDVERFKPRLGALNSAIIKVLFVGRLDSNKGVAKLLELAHLIENKADWHLSLVVNNPHNTNLFSKFNNVTIKVGLDLAVMQDEYTKHDVLYFPSQYEGFEMVSLEALASGLPVVGNKVGAVAELSARGFFGVYCIDNDNLLGQLQEVAMKFSEFSIKQQLHQLVAAEFSIELYQQKLLSIIKELNKLNDA